MSRSFLQNFEKFYGTKMGKGRMELLFAQKSRRIKIGRVDSLDKRASHDGTEGGGRIRFSAEKPRRLKESIFCSGGRIRLHLLPKGAN